MSYTPAGDAQYWMSPRPSPCSLHWSFTSNLTPRNEKSEGKSLRLVVSSQLKWKLTSRQAYSGGCRPKLPPRQRNTVGSRKTAILHASKEVLRFHTKKNNECFDERRGSSRTDCDEEIRSLDPLGTCFVSCEEHCLLSYMKQPPCQVSWDLELVVALDLCKNWRYQRGANEAFKVVDMPLDSLDILLKGVESFNIGRSDSMCFLKNSSI